MDRRRTRQQSADSLLRPGSLITISYVGTGDRSSQPSRPSSSGSSDRELLIRQRRGHQDVFKVIRTGSKLQERGSAPRREPDLPDTTQDGQRGASNRPRLDSRKRKRRDTHSSEGDTETPAPSQDNQPVQSDQPEQDNGPLHPDSVAARQVRRARIIDSSKQSRKKGRVSFQPSTQATQRMSKSTTSRCSATLEEVHTVSVAEDIVTPIPFETGS